MFRLSPFFSQHHPSPYSSTLLSQEEQSATILINRIRENRKKRRHNRGGGAHGFFSFRALTASRLQGYVVAGGMVIGAAVVLGPWLINEYKEMLGLHYTPLDPSYQPALSVDWWESEWRKMNPTWRRGENDEGFYENLCSFIATRTGRDIRSAASFQATHPSATAFSTKSVSSTSTTTPPPRVLIPLCGDSPLIAQFAQQGYVVDGIDASQTAMRSAVERTERLLPVSLYHRVRFHWMDFFSPALWEQGGPLAYHAPSMTGMTRGGGPRREEDEEGKKKGWRRFCRAPASGASTVGSPLLSNSSVSSSSLSLSGGSEHHEGKGWKWWRRGKDLSNGNRTDSTSSSGRKHTGVHPPQFDLIYERQGITSIPLWQREDYAYLLQRALKPDGILYVEGIFRTGRVANNKHAGPPYGLSRKELRQLFSDAGDGSSVGEKGVGARKTTTTSTAGSLPGMEEENSVENGAVGSQEKDWVSGFHVECEERNDAMTSLSREDRVLRRVPKELYVTPFHCVVYRKGALNLERLKALAESQHA